MTEAGAAYSLRPALQGKFRPKVAQEVMRDVLKTKLTGKQYASDECNKLTKEITDEIRDRLKALDLSRYKFVVNVLLTEQRGQGIRVGCRCFWDSDSDNYAQESFQNESIICVASAFAVYFY